MAESQRRIAVVSELSRAQNRQPADIIIEPPSSGYMRVHISLSDLPSTATLTLDIVPSSSEVGSVRVSR